MLNFYRFLSLEEKKIGTSHGFILSPLIFAEQGGNKHAVYGWGFRGKGRRILSHTNVIISKHLRANLRTKKNLM